MGGSTTWYVTCAAGLALLLATADASAEIKFCNRFPHEVYAAIAYPQDEHSWISRGWLMLEVGDCTEFDAALHPKTFYYRAESAPYRSAGKMVRSAWGAGNTQFAILEGQSFNYWNAQTKGADGSLANFNKGGDFGEEAATVTITFGVDGKVSIETTSPASLTPNSAP